MINNKKSLQEHNNQNERLKESQKFQIQQFEIEQIKIDQRRLNQEKILRKKEFLNELKKNYSHYLEITHKIENLRTPIDNLDIERIDNYKKVSSSLIREMEVKKQMLLLNNDYISDKRMSIINNHSSILYLLVKNPIAYNDDEKPRLYLLLVYSRNELVKFIKHDLKRIDESVSIDELEISLNTEIEDEVFDKTRNYVIEFETILKS